MYNVTSNCEAEERSYDREVNRGEKHTSNCLATVTSERTSGKWTRLM
jgi:hypothetical protein